MAKEKVLKTLTRPLRRHPKSCLPILDTAFVNAKSLRQLFLRKTQNFTTHFQLLGKGSWRRIRRITEEPNDARYQTNNWLSVVALPIMDRRFIHFYFFGDLFLRKAEFQPSSSDVISERSGFGRICGILWFSRLEDHMAKRQRRGVPAVSGMIRHASVAARYLRSSVTLVASPALFLTASTFTSTYPQLSSASCAARLLPKQIAPL